jgi:hypothetical protein
MASPGLTLVEVVVAAAIVLLVVTAASSTMGGVSAAGARAGGRDAAEAAVASELAALRGLPFAAQGPAAAAVVATVFPHADPAAATPQSFFAVAARDGCPAGTFFTVRDTPAGPLTVAATFLTSTSCGWAPVDAARLEGFDARTAAALPAAALLVRTSVAWRVGTRAGVVTRATIIADRPDGLCRLVAPTAVP